MTATGDGMAADWHELTELTAGEPMVVERVRLPNKGTDVTDNRRRVLDMLAEGKIGAD